MKCNFCQKLFKTRSSFSQHERSCKLNPDRLEIKPWNLGKTKINDERLLIASLKLSETIRLNGRPKFSEEGLKNLSEHAKARGLGGYRPHPNRGTRYNGIWFDSLWEVALAKDLDLNQIKWTRPSVGLVWTDQGNKYYPDFFLPDYNVFLDPKNEYLQIQDKLKISEAEKRNSVRVIVLSKHQLTWSSVKTLL